MMRDILKNTMTVGELKTLLEHYSDDLPILVEWEEQHVPITYDSVNFNMYNNTAILEIDANDY